MTKDPRFAPIFQRLIDAPEAVMAAIRQDPHGFAAAAMAEEGNAIRADAVIPAFQSLEFLLFDAADRRVRLPAHAWRDDIHMFDQLYRKGTTGKDAPRLFQVRDASGQVEHMLWAPAPETRDWNLPASVRQALDTGVASRLVIVAAACRDGPIDAAARSLGLTDTERRAVVATVRFGSGKVAAQATGLSYGTIRDALSTATSRAGQANLPALVRAVVAAAFGLEMEASDDADLIADMIPLNQRQLAIALRIAGGATREQTAASMHLSKSVVKKELETIYANLGVTSAAELARIIVEIRALRLFARATDGAPGFFDPAIEPTRFTPRHGSGERIAWSDYGPASGRPVLVVHSNWSCRAVPRPLVKALHGSGWRPIAIDRPGFGSTHPGSISRSDPFSQSIADMVQIFDVLGLGRVPVLARCGAQFVHAAREACPDRIGPVLLVSPTPAGSAEGKRAGVVGAIKEAFYRSPPLIELFFRVISAQITLARVDQLTRAIVSGCPADEALCDDPAFMLDRLRSIRPFSTGNLSGAVIEEHVINQDAPRPSPLPSSDVLVLQGCADNHHSVEEVRGYWEPLLPAAGFEMVEDGGRFMTSSHAALLVDRLGRLATSRHRR